MSEITIKVDGVQLTGLWEGFELVRSMDTLAGGFSLRSTDLLREGLVKPNIKTGSSVKLEIDGHQVLEGYLEGLFPTYSSTGQRIDIMGRDKTADLVDCDFNETVNEWKNSTIENLIENLCRPYGITVFVDSSATNQVADRLDSYKACEGMKVGEMIASLCRDAGVTPLNYGDGKLTLTRLKPSRKSKTLLQSGKNIVKGTGNFVDSDRFSEYIVKGIGIGKSSKELTDFISPAGSTTDSVVKRTRKNVTFAENATNNALCARRAKMERNYRAGQAGAIEYTVDEWIQEDGKPWDINLLVDVKDDIFGINDTLLISEVRFLLPDNDIEESGEITVLKLVDKDTYMDTTKNMKTDYDK